jgi:hypothetical protein
MEVEGRMYGGTGTIHRTGYVDVETHNGQVVAVWFRCQPLDFEQTEVEMDRGADMMRMYREGNFSLNGVVMSQ